MASENSMIVSLKDKIGKLPCTRIKKLWSSATNRDIDILVVTYGLAGFYEIKILGEKPTAWQYNRLAFWAASGADTRYFDTVNACVLHVEGLQVTFNLNRNLRMATHWQQLAIEASK
jgi:hypothetical protein